MKGIKNRWDLDRYFSAIFSNKHYVRKIRWPSQLFFRLNRVLIFLGLDPDSVMEEQMRMRYWRVEAKSGFRGMEVRSVSGYGGKIFSWMFWSRIGFWSSSIVSIRSAGSGSDKFSHFWIIFFWGGGRGHNFFGEGIFDILCWFRPCFVILSFLSKISNNDKKESTENQREMIKLSHSYAEINYVTMVLILDGNSETVAHTWTIMSLYCVGCGSKPMF